MKIKLLGLAFVCALAAAAPSFGSGPPIVARILAVGKMQATTIDVKAGTTVLDSIKIAPGGSFGWHTHGAPVAVVVTAGTLTVFDPTVAGCAPVKVSKGQSFVEPAEPRPPRPQRRQDPRHRLRAVPRPAEAVGREQRRNRARRLQAAVTCRG